MANDPNLNPPNRTVGDIVHTVAKATISAIPLVGGSVSEILNLVFLPPLLKRREKWFQYIADTLQKIQNDHDIQLEALQSNEAFISTVIQATNAAMKTHQEEKLHALRNVVLNSALPYAPEDIFQQIFVSLVENLTVFHLEVLGKFPRTTGEIGAFAGQLYVGDQDVDPSPKLMYYEFKLNRVPDHVNAKDLHLKIWQDLEASGLIVIQRSNVIEYEQNIHILVTALGKKFLDFITEPTLANKE